MYGARYRYAAACLLQGNVDLTSTIGLLKAELERLNATIAALESLDACNYVAVPARTGQRRGRKSMGEDERKQVAERMRRYWAGRRTRQL